MLSHSQPGNGLMSRGSLSFVGHVSGHLHFTQKQTRNVTGSNPSLSVRPAPLWKGGPGLEGLELLVWEGRPRPTHSPALTCQGEQEPPVNGRDLTEE